jgi:hypothetical protein
MAKAGRRARAYFATADDDLRSASVALLLGHPDRYNFTFHLVA